MQCWSVVVRESCALSDIWCFSNRTCCLFLLCEVQFVSGSKLFSCAAFCPFPFLIGGVGRYRVGKYLHCLGQCDGAWWVVAACRVAVDGRVPCSGLVAKGSLLALESLPTLAGTISKLIYWQ